MKRSVSIFRDFLSISPASKNERSRFVIWLSFLLAGLFLYLALRELDWRSFLISIKNADYVYLPLMFLWSTASYLMRALRWRFLLAIEKTIPPWNIFWANMAGYLGNNILPARAGELVRAAYVGNQNKIAISFALATGLVERFVDLLALIVIGSISLSLTGIISTALRNALISMSIIGATGLIVIMFSPYFKKQLNWIALSIPFLSTSTREKVLGLLDQFLRGFEALHHPGRIASLILFTFLIWTMDAIGTVFLAHTLHLKIFLIQAFLLLAALGLSSAIPSTPGYIGVYQFVAVMVLKPFGISSANSLAFILFSQIMNFLAVTIWGVIAILKRSRL